MISVSSAVAAEQNFDAIVAVTYAVEHDFQGFQAYLNSVVIQDAELRRQIRTRCQQAGIRLIAHAPGTLNWATVSDDAINAAACDLLASEDAVRVVHHYDETLTIDESLACIEYLHRHGITTCLENYFLRGAATAETCFQRYLELLRAAKDAGFPCIPVFDIPRLYYEKVNLVQKASALIASACETFRALNTPVILHLIDVADVSQARNCWRPIGQGIIPYASIFEQFRREQIPIVMTVLEFEDAINPIASQDFFRKYLIINAI